MNRKNIGPYGEPRLRDAPGVSPRLRDKEASPSGDLEKARIRRAIAITGIAMVPMTVLGILVAVTLGANPLVAAPLVLLVGGLMAKIASYYFQLNE